MPASDPVGDPWRDDTTPPDPVPRAGRGWWIAFAVLVMVVVAGSVVMAGRAGLGEDGDAVADATDTPPAAAVTIEVGDDVDIVGDPLPRLPDGALAGQVPDPAVGLTAPVVTGQDFTGATTTAPVDGRATVIVFLAHWCPHCQAEFPRLLTAWITPDLPDDVAVVAVPTAQQPQGPNWPPSTWMLGGDPAWDEPVLLDTPDQEVAAAMGVTSYPFFVVVAPDGTVAARVAGEQGVEGLAGIIDYAADLP